MAAANASAAAEVALGAAVTREPRVTASVRDTARATNYVRLAWFLIVSLALVFSRWVLFPRYLVTFDEINFALAIREFNPRLHQPQPPGYPLFVALLKVLSPIFPSVESVFLAAGLLLSGASLLLIWKLGGLATGARWGWTGALLLLFHPAFWLSALTNPVRLSLAFGASLVAWCVWKALREPARWLPAAAAALGLMGGFQPTLLLLMAPLLLWAAIRARVSRRLALLAVSCLAGGVALWLPVLIHATGGWRYFLLVIGGYSDTQFSGTSLFFGAPLSAALDMVEKAIVWSCLGVLSWFWLLPFTIRQRRRPSDSLLPWFLAIWFLPGFLFYAVFHVGDPDHTLSIVPATCVAGAAVLTAIGRRTSQRIATCAIVVCALLNVVLFFKPISKTAEASTYKSVRWLNAYTTHVVEGFRGVQREHPTPAVFHSSSGIWRQIYYYEPRAPLILVDPGDVRTAALTRLRWGRTEGRKVVNLQDPVRVCGPILLFNPIQNPPASVSIVWKAPEPGAFLARAALGQPVEFYGIRFISLAGACSGTPPEGDVFPLVGEAGFRAAP